MKKMEGLLCQLLIPEQASAGLWFMEPQKGFLLSLDKELFPSQGTFKYQGKAQPTKVNSVWKLLDRQGIFKSVNI